MKNKLSLRQLVFMAICCDLGIVCKKLVSPLANVFTDALHIPGGIGTSFSLMFIVIGAVMTTYPFSGTLMGAVQSVIALVMGSVGSMGVLSPIGYVMPGIGMDLLLALWKRFGRIDFECIVVVNAVSSVLAAITANLIVFRLWGVVLALYLCVAALSGSVCGIVASMVVARLRGVLKVKGKLSEQKEEKK